MKLNMLKGLKESFSKPALKSAAGAMAGGAVASVAHLVVATKVAWFNSSWKRVGLAALIGTVGAHYVAGKHKNAAAGVQGAMGGVIGIELWNMFSSGAMGAKVAGLRGLPDAFPPADRPLMSNFRGTRLTLTPGGPGVGFQGTQILQSRGLRGTTLTPIRPAASVLG
jgi:hypothetical protein